MGKNFAIITVFSHSSFFFFLFCTFIATFIHRPPVEETYNFSFLEQCCCLLCSNISSDGERKISLEGFFHPQRGQIYKREKGGEAIKEDAPKNPP